MSSSVSICKAKLPINSKHGLFALSIVLVSLLILLTWVIISKSQNKIIEFKSLNVANVVATQATMARSVYTKSVVSKLTKEGYGASTNSANIPGAVPIPAQFLKQLATKSRSQNDGLYSFAPLSKWNLSPDQGLTDDFQIWAWERLEAQNKNLTGEAIKWEPVWRIETINDMKVLRYLYADPAASQSCVNCHNRMELLPETVARREAAGVETGKQWQLNELMGALEVVVPMDESSALAHAQTKSGLTILAIVGVASALIFAVFLALDSARTNKMTSELQYQANHDYLTTLPNRSGFEKALEELLEEHSAGDSHTLMLLDLDDFKRINDTLGHEIGDEVLKEVSQRLLNTLGESNLVARLGGDEFAVLLPNCDEEKANRTAKLLDDTLAETMSIGEYQLRSAGSIGIAMAPKNGTDSKELLRCADVAMYNAKNARAPFAFYNTDEDTNQLTTLSIIADFRQALEQGDLSLVYQPKFDIKAGCISGVEALLRWKHPTLGMISPIDIIPVAEQCGLISQLTHWTLVTALSQLKEWHKLGFKFSVAVNMSAQMLHDRESVDLIINDLTNSGVAAELLTIEVTESAMMMDPECAGEILARLNEQGIILSIDDFGTGYSSLAYIHTLPIKELKLDRSFVSDLGLEGKDTVIVNTAIELAHNLNLKLVAEGVEHAHSLDYLASIDCDIVQGYYLCKPKYADELTRLLPSLTALAAKVAAPPPFKKAA